MCPEKKRTTWWCQSYRWFKRSVRDHTRVQMSNGSYCCLRDSFAWRETMIYKLRYCRLNLFVYGWLIPLLISWVLTKSTKHSTNSSQQYLYQKKKKNNNNNNRNNLKAVFCLLELFVYIQLVTWARLSSKAKFGNAQFEPACIETPPVSFICLFRRRQVNLK